jgi:hypothetical protein
MLLDAQWSVHGLLTAAFAVLEGCVSITVLMLVNMTVDYSVISFNIL